MLVVLTSSASAEAIERVCAAIRAHGAQAHLLGQPGTRQIAVSGLAAGQTLNGVSTMEGVERIVQPDRPYPLASRALHAEQSVIDCGGLPIGGPALAIIAGPCAIESYEQTLTVARHVAAAGARALRGGAYKPRTSPYDFQGLGEEGLAILAEVKAQTGLRIVTEAMEIATIEAVAAVADVIQVGARNMQNFPLLAALGSIGTPVLLKRGFGATLNEWLLAAEYILARGNPHVILCERGIRTFADHTRNTLDLSVVPAARLETHLPIVVDPSHGTGRRALVPAMAKAAIAAGADGLLIEVHADPKTALSDGPQAILPEEFATLMRELEQLAPILGRALPLPVAAREG